MDEDAFRREAAADAEWLLQYQGTQEIHIQLANLLLQSPFRFGGVEIHPIPNTGDLTEYQLKYKGSFENRSLVDAVNSYAVVRESPGLGTKAWRNAVEMAEGVLTVIRAIGVPTLWGWDWREAGVAGRGPASGFVILRDRVGPWDMSMPGYISIGMPLMAWYMRLEDMIRNYSLKEIECVERIYLKQRPSKMEWKALRALHWLGEATFPADIASKFAKLSIAFETAVGGQVRGDDQLKEIGITQMLAERTAFLLGKNRQTRLDWHRAVVKLYGSRSKVMHGELEPISEEDLKKWAFLVWKVVRALLNRVSEFTTVEQFEHWVRTQRYMLPSDSGQTS